jgi:hypothetical protein
MICIEIPITLEFWLKCGLNSGDKLQPGLVMDNRGEDEHEEEMDFHLGTADDNSSNDENTSSNSSLSSMRKEIGGDAQRDAPVNYPYDSLFIWSILWVCGS